MCANVLSFCGVVGTLFLMIFATAIADRVELIIVAGEGFIGQLHGNVSLDRPAIVECALRRNNVTYNLLADIVQRTAFGEYVSPFGVGQCGVRVRNVSVASIGEWPVHGVFANGDNVTRRFIIKDVYPPKRTDTIVIPVGSGAVTQALQCPKTEATRFCQLENGSVEAKHILIAHRAKECRRTTELTRNSKNWKCRTLEWGAIGERETAIELDFDPAHGGRRRPTIARLRELKDQWLLTCEMPGVSISSCLVELPDAKQHMMLQNGLLSERFSAWDTNTTESRCTLEILKPLHHEEHGIWRVLSSMDDTVVAGCLFYIGDETALIAESQRHNQLQVIELRQSTQFDIVCEVAYPIRWCYLRSPSGHLKMLGPDELGKGREIGRCSFEKLTPEAGVWSCGVNGYRLQDPGVTFEYEVHVAGNQSASGRLVSSARTSVGSGEQLTIRCESLFDYSLTACFLIRPNGTIIVVEEQSPNYVGRGLMYGECGARVTVGGAEDFGEWQCGIVLREPYGNPQVLMPVMVQVSKSHWGTVIGAAVGVAVVIGSASFTYNFYRKARGPRSMPLNPIN